MSVKQTNNKAKSFANSVETETPKPKGMEEKPAFLVDAQIRYELPNKDFVRISQGKHDGYVFIFTYNKSKNRRKHYRMFVFEEESNIPCLTQEMISLYIK